MTCIVGFVDTNGDVYMGADSAGVSGYNIRERIDCKVFIKKEMIFGFTSSFRMGQLINYQLNIPEQLPSVDDYTYMCTSFITAVINCFKDHGYAKVQDNKVSGGVFLVGYKGKIYEIESDFQVGCINSNFNACGCGDNYAFGALEMIEKLISEGYMQNIKPSEKIIKILEIAEKFSAGVSKPFNILRLTNKMEV